MGRGEKGLRVAKQGFQEAEREGNHEEQVQWASTVPTSSSVVASTSRPSTTYEKLLLPTCKYLGDVYLRLDHFVEALISLVVSHGSFEGPLPFSNEGWDRKPYEGGQISMLPGGGVSREVEIEIPGVIDDEQEAKHAAGHCRSRRR